MSENGGMTVVTIEGTTMPAAGVLRRGERKTVQYTNRIQRLVSGGFVKIVEEHDTPVPIEELSITDRLPRTQIDIKPGTAPIDGVPSRNSNTETWKQFLTQKGISYPEDAGRSQLIAFWDKVTGRPAPSGS